MLKLINTSRFDHSGKTFIQTIRGGKIEDISSCIAKIRQCNPKSIVIHVGTNNLASDSPDMIIEKFETMIPKTNKQFPSAKLFISEIIPREKSNGPNNDVTDIPYINRTLQNLTKKYDSQIISHDNLQDANYRYDGLHLTYKGTSIFVESIKTTCWPSTSRQTKRVPNTMRKQQPQQSEIRQQSQQMQQPQPKQQPQQSNEQQQTNTVDRRETQQMPQTNSIKNTGATNLPSFHQHGVSPNGILPLQNYRQPYHGFVWPYGNYDFPYFPTFPPFTMGPQWPRNYGQTY